MPVPGVPGGDPSINYPPPLKLKDEHWNEYKILYTEIEEAAETINGNTAPGNGLDSERIEAANKSLQAACLKYAEYPTKANREAVMASVKNFTSTVQHNDESSMNPGQDMALIANMNSVVQNQMSKWTP